MYQRAIPIFCQDVILPKIINISLRVNPKGTDFSELTDEMLAEIEWKLNHRPRKSLGYRTPLENCKQLFIFDF
jgi:hypothetical protein